MMASFDCKFKTNQKNIEKALQHFGLRRIQPTLYVGEIDNDERGILMKNIAEIVKEKDSVLIVPICQSCFSKKEYCGREIKFKDDFCLK